jgi:CelD/BcsL family acetyltransferase involved in cellulose biosynthesis
MNNGVSLITTLDGFRSLGTAWRAIVAEHPHLDLCQTFEWILSYLEHAAGAPRDLFVLVTRNGNHVSGIFPLFKRTERYGWLTLRALDFVGAGLTPLRGPVLRRGFEKEAVEAFWEALQGNYANEWDVFACGDLSPKDPSCAAFISKLQTEARFYDLRKQFDSMASDVKKFSSSKDFFATLGPKTRRNLRHTIRGLSEHGSLYCSTLLGADAVEKLDAFFEIFDKSWKGPDRNPRLQRGLYVDFAARGTLRMHLIALGRPRPLGEKIDSADPWGVEQRAAPLNDNDEVVAGCCAIAFGKTTVLLRTAYVLEERYAQLSPGLLSLYSAIAWAIDQDGSTTIDYRMGSEEYKHKLLAEVADIRHHLLAFNPKRRFLCGGVGARNAAGRLYHRVTGR